MLMGVLGQQARLVGLDARTRGQAADPSHSLSHTSSGPAHGGVIHSAGLSGHLFSWQVVVVEWQGGVVSCVRVRTC